MWCILQPSAHVPQIDMTQQSRVQLQMQVSTDVAGQKRNARGKPPQWQALPKPVVAREAMREQLMAKTVARTDPCRRCNLSLPPTESSELVNLLFGMSGALDGCGLTQAEIRSLCSRDITPEDYDMLLQLDDGVSKNPSGLLDAVECERLPRPHSASSYEGKECAVCLAELSKNDDMCVLQCCQHVFHKQCIVQWLTCVKAKCPLDGSDVVLGPF